MAASASWWMWTQYYYPQQHLIKPVCYESCSRFQNQVPIHNLFVGNHHHHHHHHHHPCRSSGSIHHHRLTNRRRIICSSYSSSSNNKPPPTPDEPTGVQLYSQIERLLTETVRQSQDSWATSRDWTEVEGAWVLKPRNLKPKAVVHFIGGIFVGAAPQLTYRMFLERLSEKGILVIATPYASGFDHFFIADEVQFKFDRCMRFLHETVQDLPTFGIGHSLGSLIHLLIGIVRSAYCILLIVVQLILFAAIYIIDLTIAQDQDMLYKEVGMY